MLYIVSIGFLFFFSAMIKMLKMLLDQRDNTQNTECSIYDYIYTQFKLEHRVQMTFVMVFKHKIL